MLWLLSQLLFRKFGSETVNKACIKKSLAKSLMVFELKSPRLLSPDWFPCRDNIKTTPPPQPRSPNGSNGGEGVWTIHHLPYSLDTVLLDFFSPLLRVKSKLAGL
jgi:hypothetical protein